MQGKTVREETFRKLLRFIDRDNIPQAVLLQGPAGSGKGKLAVRFAMALLCQEGSPPCGSCRSCQLFTGENHPSFFEVVPDRTEIRVDQIRILHEELTKEAFFGKRRVILICRADRMNRNAANSLLKILEEPPPSVHFLLTASQGGKVPPTIRSRCTTLSIPPLKESEMAESSTDKAAIQVSEGNLDLLQGLTSGTVPPPGEILKALLSRDLRKIGDIAASFKDERVFPHGAFVLKRLLLDLILLSKDEKQCIINRDIATERKVQRLISNPQKLVEFFYIISALDFLPHQVNRAFVCEAVLLSLSEMEVG